MSKPLDIVCKGWDMESRQWIIGFYMHGSRDINGQAKHELMRTNVAGNYGTAVDPESVGLHIGCTDSTGAGIFCRDIVEVEDDLDNKTRHEVRYCGADGYPAFDLEPCFGDGANGISRALATAKVTVVASSYKGATPAGGGDET